MPELPLTTSITVNLPLLSLSKMAESKMQIQMMQMEEMIANMAAQIELLTQAIEHLTAQQQGMQAAALRSGAPFPSLCRLHKIKPAPPSDFSGDQAKGRAFLNSCELYMQLAGDQFPGEEEKISWAYSYMKSG